MDPFLKSLKTLYNAAVDYFDGEDDFLDQLVHDLKRHEGCRLKAYLDTVGVWTIGYGHTAGVKEGDVITADEAEDLLYDDVQDAINDAKAVVASFDALDAVRRGVCANLAFNLGRKKLSGFHRTLNCINNGDYEAAADALKASLWYRQVKSRGVELVERMRLGRIRPEHLYHKGDKK